MLPDEPKLDRIATTVFAWIIGVLLVANIICQIGIKLGWIPPGWSP